MIKIQVNSLNNAFLVIVLLPLNLLNLAISNSASVKLIVLIVECSKMENTSKTSIYPLLKYLSNVLSPPSFKNYPFAF